MGGAAEHELGIGISFGAAPLDAREAALADAEFDFVEIPPQHDLRASNAHRPHRSTVINSAWVPVGGSCEPDAMLLARLEENVRLRRPAYVCEQLSFNRFPTASGPRATGYPLPPQHTPAGVAVAVKRIVQLRERLHVPVAFEIGVRHFAKQPQELAAKDFHATIAEHARCGIVLDLAHLSAQNCDGYDSPGGLPARFPLDRIWEVQISAEAPPEIRLLAERLVPVLPALRAIVLEVRRQTRDDRRANLLPEQHAWLRSLWSARGSLARDAPSPSPRIVLPDEDEARARASAWERSVVAGITGLAAPGGRDAAAFAALGTLVANARGTAIAQAAEYSLRLLEATLGKRELVALVRRYCSETHAEFSPANEARQFLHFVERERHDVPFLREVVAFERAAAAALRCNSQTSVYFSCEPTEIFRALLRRDRPYVSDRRPYTVHVGPGGIRIEGPFRQAG